MVASDPPIHTLPRSLRFPGISTTIPRTLSNSLKKKSELLQSEGLGIKEIESRPVVISVLVGRPPGG